jgi:hypothetical protein
LFPAIATVVDADDASDIENCRVEGVSNDETIALPELKIVKLKAVTTTSNAAPAPLN